MDICRNRRSARYLQGVPNPYQISYFDLYEQSGQELWTSCKYMAFHKIHHSTKQGNHKIRCGSKDFRCSAKSSLEKCGAKGR